MSAGTARAQVWMENLGDWSWPGRAAEAVEALPPSWVPAFPPRLEPAASGAPAPGSWGQPRALPRVRARGALLSGLVAICAALALSGPLHLREMLGLRGTTPPQRTTDVRALGAPAPLPTLVAVSHDSAGSSIDAAGYASGALQGHGSFLVYLPPGYASTTLHYPVIYLLHGNSQPATAFLQIGLQHTLDRLIARHAVPPSIAVMIQGGWGANNWRDQGRRHYEAYVLEVQQLVDRMLPTVADRGGRAILGDSMGGYGAMNLTLGHPDRFSVVESWLGFFNGLDGELRAARPAIARDGLRAFLYGGKADEIADPSENAPFASALRAAGARADSAVYPGGHTMETLEAHLPSMLAFAGRSLAQSANRQAARPRAAGART